jgi:outer membrane protein assembly factor BamE (lipoprotein component of BamABCDE complex)
MTSLATLLRSFICLSLFFIASCQQVQKRGFAFDLSDYDRLQEGINDKDDVLEAMGYPSFTSENKDGEAWVYYSEDVQKLLFFKTKILERQMVAFSFAADGKIANIGEYDLDDEKEVAFSGKITKVASQKKSWWKRIFDNIGQVRAN